MTCLGALVDAKIEAAFLAAAATPRTREKAVEIVLVDRRETRLLRELLACT